MILGASGTKRKFPAGQVGESMESPFTQESFLTARHPADRVLAKMTGPSLPNSQASYKVPPGNEIIDLTNSPPSGLRTMGSKPNQVIIDLTSDSPSPERPNLDPDHQYALELQATFDMEYIEAAGNPNDLMLKKSRFGSLEEAKLFADEENMAEWTKSDSRLSVDYLFESENLPDLTLWRPDQIEEDGKLAATLQSQYDAERQMDQKVVNQGPVESSIPIDDEIKQSRSMLFEYGQKIIKKRCTCCRKVLLLDESTVNAINTASFKSQRQSSIHECSSCKVRTCIGCGKQEKKYLFEKKIDGWTITWCCDEGRLFLIWRLLCHLKGRKPGPQSYLPAKIVTSLKSSTPHGKKSGVGYGDNNRGVRRRGPEPLVKVVEHDPSDTLIRNVLVAISSILPNWQNENVSAFDTDPPSILRVMFRRSALLDKVAELLRNDSIENVGKRIHVYGEVIRFMHVLSSHPVTARMCFEERISYPESSGILAVTLGPEPRGRSRRHSAGDNNLEKTQSLETIMQPLQLQARAYAKQAKAVGSLLEDELPAQILNLCENIIHLAAFLKANAPLEEDNTKLDDGSNSKSVNMTEWHRENCLEDIPDEEIMETHRYRQAATNLAASNKGRMKRLMTELANLQTSLPEGIYLRHGSSRLDMMKVLIIGPRDTPYENGIFEFDVFCPGNYPNEPPKVHFKTTGGGVAHFNPNLYPEGKVCLSLIGTWSGEPWRPSQSTLLQVFVSIQSMIFCDEPWCNEPGRESHVGQPASLNYNRTIRKLTIDHALWAWAKGFSNGIWSTIVERHFRSNAEPIAMKVKEWAKEGFNNKPSYGPSPMPFVPVQPAGISNLAPGSPSALGLDFDATEVPMNWASPQPPLQSMQPMYPTNSFPDIPDSGMNKGSIPGPFVPSQGPSGSGAAIEIFGSAEGILKQPDMQSFKEDTKLVFDFVTTSFPPLPFNLPAFIGPANPPVLNPVQPGGGLFPNFPALPPQPVPDTPLPGYVPVLSIPHGRLPPPMMLNKNMFKLPLAPLDNMTGEMQHLLLLLGATPWQVMGAIISKSDPMEVLVKDLIGGIEMLPSIYGPFMKSNKYLTYHHTASALTNGNTTAEGPYFPSLVPTKPPVASTKPLVTSQGGLMGPLMAEMMIPSATKPAYLFQPNPFAPKPPSPQHTPAKEEEKKLSWQPDGGLSVASVGSHFGKKVKKLQKKSMSVGAEITPGSSSSNSQGSLLPVHLPQERLLDDKTRELIELLEGYRKKELMGEPL